MKHTRLTPIIALCVAANCSLAQDPFQKKLDDEYERMFPGQAAAKWQAKAIEAYPDLGVPDSLLSKTFRQIHEQLKETTPQLFNNPKWPLLIAQLAGGDPKPQTPVPPFFIVVNTPYQWPDGLSSPAGEVERAIEIDAQNYILWHPSGKRYPIPKANATILKAEDAAAKLFELRNKLAAQLAAGTPQQVLTIEQAQQLMQLANQIQDFRNKQLREQSGTLEQRKQMLDFIEQLQGLGRRR